MLQYLPVKDDTLCQIQTLLKKMLFSRPSLASTNKAGQKVSSVSHRKFKTNFLSKKSLHFKMELFSRESRHTISNESWTKREATLQSSGSAGMPETSKRSFLLAWYVQRGWRICLQVWSLQYIPPRAAQGAHDLTPSTIKTMAGPRCWPHWAPGPGLPYHYWLLIELL